MISKTEVFTRDPSVPPVPPSVPIQRFDDLLSHLTNAIKAGIGGEVRIEKPSVSNEIASKFSWTYRMGGNAGNMANVLAQLGAEPVVNLPKQGIRQASLFHPKVKTPTRSCCELCLVHPTSLIHSSTKTISSGRGHDDSNLKVENADLTHFVFQFPAGMKVLTPNGLVVAPRENRFIASFDQLNSEMATDPEFKAYMSSCKGSVDAALISGFHMVPSSIFNRVLRLKAKEIAYLDDIFVHLEMGQFEEPWMIDQLLDEIHADSVGMNEQELSMTVKDAGDGSREQLLDTTIGQLKGIIENAKALRNRFSISRLCVHTRDYVLSIIPQNADPLRELKAIAFGIDLAATLASSGSVIGKPRFADQMISYESSIIMKQMQNNGAVLEESGTHLQGDDEIVCLSPSKRVTKTVVNVGLGDTLTSGILFGELRDGPIDPALKNR